MSPGDDEKTARRLELAAAAVLTGVGWSLVADPTRVNHDVASLLMGVVEWSEGLMPFAGIAGMNPPLISYFDGLAVALARLTGCGVPAAHSVLVLAFCVASLLLLRKLLALTPGLSPVVRASALLGAAAGVGAAVVPFFHWGQREQLWITGFAPYLVLRNLRAERGDAPRGLAAAAGILAAFGCLLKPHFILAGFACEAALALVHRRVVPLKTPEVIAGSATALAYAAHFLFLPRDYLAAFVAAVRSTAAGYAAFETPFRDLLRPQAVAVAAFAVAMALLALAAGSTAPRRLAAAFGALTAAGLGVYFLQAKGWAHHAYPALFAALLTAGALLPTIPRSAAAVRAAAAAARAALALSGLALAVSVLLAAGAAWRLARLGVHVPVRSPVYAALFRWTAPREETLFVTSSVPLMYPALLETDRRGLGRFYGPWMQVAFAKPERSTYPPTYRPLAALSPTERGLVEGMERLVAERRPRTIFLAASGNLGCPPGFSFVEYLRAAGSFDRALAPYARVVEVDDRWGSVEVYRRAPASASPMEPATHSSISRVSPG